MSFGACLALGGEGGVNSEEVAYVHLTPCSVAWSCSGNLRWCCQLVTPSGEQLHCFGGGCAGWGTTLALQCMSSDDCKGHSHLKHP